MSYCFVYNGGGDAVLDPQGKGNKGMMVRDESIEKEKKKKKKNKQFPSQNSKTRHQSA